MEIKRVSTFSFFTSLLIFHSQVLLCSSFTSFVFGDSLVDSGNNNYLLTLSKADSPPYGIDFIPSGGQPTGRFTNGLTISDIVGEALGAKSFPPPYLAPNSVGSVFDIGINYASGASGILDQTGNLFIGRMPLKEQIHNFEKTREYMVNVVGEQNTSNILKNAVFSITIGSNDVLNYFQLSIPFLNENVSPTLFQDYMVSNLTFQLERLLDLGAQRFVVVGVGPIGCIPFVRATNLIPNGKCSLRVNTVVRGYNAKLRSELTRMNEKMGHNAIFLYANSFDIFRDIILNYHNYGFENSDGPCCGGYFPPFVCYEGKDSNSTSSVVCGERKNYVFWDAYHPTQAANLIVADKLLNGDKSSCSPINVRQLYNYDFRDEYIGPSDQCLKEDMGMYLCVNYSNFSSPEK